MDNIKASALSAAVKLTAGYKLDDTIKLEVGKDQELADYIVKAAKKAGCTTFCTEAERGVIKLQNRLKNQWELRFGMDTSFKDLLMNGKSVRTKPKTIRDLIKDFYGIEIDGAGKLPPTDDFDINTFTV